MRRRRNKTRRDRFLSEIEGITPWPSLLNVIAPHYPVSGKRGHPPIGLERILRMYIVQQCFGFSDEGTEDAVYDSQAVNQRAKLTRVLGETALKSFHPELLNYQTHKGSHKGSGRELRISQMS